MAPKHRVFLHIGAPKTGTTFLQAVLARNRAALAERGLTYPRLQGDAHHKAVWDLRGTPPQREGSAGIHGQWDELVRQVRSAPGDALVSSEHLVFTRRAEIAKAVKSFRAEVHVIYTARDLTRQVPAVWQERLKNQGTMPYHAFVAEVIRNDGHEARTFWNAQDASRVLALWAERVDPAHIHVVTTPPPGSPRRLLWDRFMSVVGLDGSDFDLEAGRKVNESLSAVQSELLRRYNERHGEGVAWVDYRWSMKGLLQVLRSVDDRRGLTLTADEHAYLHRRAVTIGQGLEQSRYDVAGDLADLIPTSPPTGDAAVEPTAVGDSDVVDAALDALHGVVAKGASRRQRRSEQRRGSEAGPGGAKRFRRRGGSAG